jgi:dolichyl-phosphate-mannose--protein O-mannosyl transferase
LGARVAEKITVGPKPGDEPAPDQGRPRGGKPWAAAPTATPPSTGAHAAPARSPLSGLLALVKPKPTGLERFATTATLPTRVAEAETQADVAEETRPAPARRRRAASPPARKRPRRAEPEIIDLDEAPSENYPAAPSLPDDKVRSWIVALVITAIGALTRFVNLGSPTDKGTPIFDEKHYAPQGWQTWQNGWIEDNPGYGLIVHPPVGKQMIALGEALFGYTPVGWRFTAAVCGVLMILIVIRIGRRIAHSTVVGAIAGILMVADGVLFVSSRVGMLDIFMGLWVLGAFACLVMDRDQVRERLFKARAEGRIWVSDFGPRLGVRWWRFGAGIFLGLAVATKWSGLYYIAFFGLMSVAFDVAARRAYGVRRPWIGSALRDIPPALYALVVIPFVAYFMTYLRWFNSETGIHRFAVGNQVGMESSFSFIPDAIRSLWYYTYAAFSFHTTLTTSGGHTHPWESKPWTWPMGLRPMLYYFNSDKDNLQCGPDGCVEAVMLIGTPAIWWISLPMLAWAAYRTIAKADWRYAAVLVGYGAGLIPWFVTMDRQMYYFYTVPLVAFLVLGIALMIGDGLANARKSRRWRNWGMGIACGYVALAVVNFMWLWPILTGAPISDEAWQSHLWLPSWK